MNIRQYTKSYSKKSNAMGAFSLFGTFAVYFAAWIVALTQPEQIVTLIPAIVIIAFASVRLYVLQHDCGHHSLFMTPRYNDMAGYVLSVFSLTPFRVMQYNHNLHHAYLGDLEHRETTEVYTMTLREWKSASFGKRLWYRAYRHPALMLGLGGFFTYFIAYRWPRNTRKVGALGVVIHNVLVLGYFGVLYLIAGWTGVLVLFVAGILAGVIGVFLVYLQHNFEDTYWDTRPDLSLRKATLIGSSSLDLGWWWDIGTGNIAYHDLHHYNPQIPSYNLRHCQRNLPDELKMHDTIRWPEAIRSFRLKLWDEDAERLVPFPKGEYSAQRQMG